MTCKCSICQKRYICSESTVSNSTLMARFTKGEVTAEELKTLEAQGLIKSFGKPKNPPNIEREVNLLARDAFARERNGELSSEGFKRTIDLIIAGTPPEKIRSLVRSYNEALGRR